MTTNRHYRYQPWLLATDRLAANAAGLGRRIAAKLSRIVRENGSGGPGR